MVSFPFLFHRAHSLKAVKSLRANHGRELSIEGNLTDSDYQLYLLYKIYITLRNFIQPIITRESEINNQPLLVFGANSTIHLVNALFYNR